WAIAHLAANGDQASVAMFGGFAIYAAIALISLFARNKTPSANKPPRLTMDVVAIVGGIIVAALLVKFHGTLFGVPLVFV
ncbi:MAG: NnrU family protein, partial [Gammaproteobacteria bacterium]|nr:NnrU family protein [Gammaproteobacteria bacterium]